MRSEINQSDQDGKEAERVDYETETFDLRQQLHSNGVDQEQNDHGCVEEESPVPPLIIV